MKRFKTEVEFKKSGAHFTSEGVYKNSNLDGWPVLAEYFGKEVESCECWNPANDDSFDEEDLEPWMWVDEPEVIVKIGDKFQSPGGYIHEIIGATNVGCEMLRNDKLEWSASFTRIEEWIKKGLFTPIPETVDGLTDECFPQAERHNSSKVDLSYIPVEATIQECKVWEFGGQKYYRNNWKKLWGDDTPNVVLASALRHMMAILDGEEIDEESGCYHAAHVRCNMAMLLEYYKNKNS